MVQRPLGKTLVKRKKVGGHPPCGTSGKKRGYAKCVPASKAARMSDRKKLVLLVEKEPHKIKLVEVEHQI